MNEGCSDDNKELEGCAVKLVHRNDAPRQVPEELSGLAELREIFDEIDAVPIPSRLAHFLPPDDPPPRGAPSQRMAREPELLPEDAEAAERQAVGGYKNIQREKKGTGVISF
jgi:hypothetical protein